MSDWIKVSYYLYCGISDAIDNYSKSPGLATPKKLKELEEVLQVYKDKCAVSFNSLEQKYKNLLNKKGEM